MSIIPSIEELNKQILLAPITDFQPHFQKGIFILIDQSLDLANVSYRIAANDQQYILELIEKALLQRPSLVEYEIWKEDRYFFNFLIIQPFVVAKKFTKLSQDS